MREKFLAPQLVKSDVWLQMVEAIEVVFGDIDAARMALARLRHPLSTEGIAVRTAAGQLTNLSELTGQDSTTLINTAEMLGFRFNSRKLLGEDGYLRLCLFLSQYYSEDKGTERFADFMGFVSNGSIRIINTWTYNYKTFLDEGDPGIGVPVYEGGDWYPTTHVVIEHALDAFTGVDRYEFLDWFYYFANINLIVNGIRMVATVQEKVRIAGAATTEVWY